MKALAIAVLLLAPADPAHASQCEPLAATRDKVLAHPGGKWVMQTEAQWQFLEGVYVLNPSTAAGLPFGDGAAVATIEGHKSAIVFFLDSDLACQPMAIPSEIVDMIAHLGDVRHEGTDQ